MNDPVVVDASLAVKWLINEVHSEKAFAVARSWARSGVQPVAPYLMPVEVTNALYRRAVLGQVPMRVATQLLEAFLGTGIELRESPGLHKRAMELADRLQQDAVYDAHYLALAEALDCELWTADERFYRAASTLYRVRWLGSYEDADKREP